MVTRGRCRGCRRCSARSRSATARPRQAGPPPPPPSVRRICPAATGACADRQRPSEKRISPAGPGTGAANSDRFATFRSANGRGSAITAAAAAAASTAATAAVAAVAPTDGRGQAVVNPPRSAPPYSAVRWGLSLPIAVGVQRRYGGGGMARFRCRVDAARRAVKILRPPEADVRGGVWSGGVRQRRGGGEVTQAWEVGREGEAG